MHGCEHCRWMPGTIHMLQANVNGLQFELHVRNLRLKEQDQEITRLRQQVEELKQQAAHSAPSPSSQPNAPPWVKPNVPARRPKKPGRRDGHDAALRPLPTRIDHHQEVPLATDHAGQCVCPHCRCPLNRLRKHRRIVEDLVPSAVEVTCYHTQSGQCPRCRRRIESRAAEQPPAANVPHGQLGIHALSTAAILRVRHRLPFRQIAQLLHDLPGLEVSPGGIVKQVKRLAKWLDGKYQDLLRQMRASEQVHVDETGWRINGRNFWLWAFTDPTFTLYHVDASRGGKVPLKLLGKSYDGTVVADFYSAYNGLRADKQRCLVHLMREVKEIGEKDAGFAGSPLARKLMRWCKEALRLKKRWKELPNEKYEMRVSRLEDRLDGIIREPGDHADAVRLCKRLTRHRHELTRFLWKEELEGTNNAAERAIRPAVVMRKITGGSRSEEGAAAWAKLASLIRTADQRQLGVYEATQKLVMDYWARAGR